MGQIVSVLLGLAGGVFAWFATNFYGRYLVSLFELRALAHEEMLFSADLTPVLDLAPYNASAERLRRIASRLKALDETAPPMVKRLWAFSGYQPGAGADAIACYAYSYDREARRAFRSNVETALRFKLWIDREERQPQFGLTIFGFL